DGAPQEPDHETGPARQEKAKAGKEYGPKDLEFVQPHQLRVAPHIRYFGGIWFRVLTGEYPSEMAIDETVVPRRMHVVPGIGIQMVMPVLRSPPDDALLRSGLGHEREDELEGPARRIGPVREIAMIACADGEDAQPIERDANSERLPGDAGPDCSEAAEMDEDEGNG